MSGCANSEDLEGTSLPTKGTSVRVRVRVTVTVTVTVRTMFRCLGLGLELRSYLRRGLQA